MIKGVNKQIIEINQPDSIYFEKAVFYLRPGVRTLPAEVSSREIERCMSRLGVTKRRHSARMGRNVIYGGIVITAAAVIISLI